MRICAIFQGGIFMSNSVFQSVILQLKEIPDRVFGVIDSEGNNLYETGCASYLESLER